MTSIGIIGSDDREITNAFSDFPLNAVTTIDSDRIYKNDEVVKDAVLGTGIVISPNHVLTAGHNSYSIKSTAQYSDIRVTTSDKEDDLIVRSFNEANNLTGVGFSLRFKKGS